VDTSKADINIHRETGDAFSAAASFRSDLCVVREAAYVVLKLSFRMPCHTT